MSDDAQTILALQSELESRRANFDSFWDEVALRVMPASATFTTHDEEGQPRSERAFDTTAITANERFAAFINDGITPRDQFWHGLAAEDDELRESQAVKEYFERLTKVLFAARYRPGANFTSQRQSNYLSLGAFGNYSLFIDEAIGEGIRYCAIPMREVFWSHNHQGQIDLQHRKFCIDARSAVKMFGDNCPGSVRDDADKKPFSKHEFVHCVRPNDELKPGAAGYRGMAWASYYVYPKDKAVISRGGYRSFPYANGRFMLAPSETYARSPAMAAFPSIMTLNEQKKTVLRAGQKAVDPPLLLQEEGALEPFNMRSGAMNYGAVSADGTPLVVPFNSGARVELGIELMGLEQRAVNDAFMVTLFSILAEKPDMTATEVMARLQEKAQLLSPTTGRLEAEDMGPMIERELDILSRAGALPPPPDELLELGAGYKVVYTSPLARARRAADALAITRTIEIAGAAAALDPAAALVVDVPASIREVAEINGMPAKLIRSPEDVEALQQQRQQQQALAAVAEGAPQIASAAKDLAMADQIRSAAA